MDYKGKECISEFDPKNFELPFFASIAALEICNYRLQRNEDTSSVEYLSELIDRITQGEKPEVIENPEIYSILFHSILGRENFEKYWKKYIGRENNSHVSEVLLQTNLLAKDLRDFKSLSEERQKTLEDFCVNLSRELDYHQQTYYPIRHRLVA